MFLQITMAGLTMTPEHRATLTESRPSASEGPRALVGHVLRLENTDMDSTKLESITLEERAGVFSALGDPIRLRVLDQLTAGQKCVCDLQATIDVAPNLLSYHMRVLREAGLVEASKRGRWVDYRLAPAAGELVHESLPVELSPGRGS